MFEAHHQGKISIEKLTEKMCHNPAILFQIEKRGYIKEGYFADIVIVDDNNPWEVKKRMCCINVSGLHLKEQLLNQK